MTTARASCRRSARRPRPDDAPRASGEGEGRSIPSATSPSTWRAPLPAVPARPPRARGLSGGRVGARFPLARGEEGPRVAPSVEPPSPRRPAVTENPQSVRPARGRTLFSTFGRDPLPFVPRVVLSPHLLLSSGSASTCEASKAGLSTTDVPARHRKWPPASSGSRLSKYPDLDSSQT